MSFKYDWESGYDLESLPADSIDRFSLGFVPSDSYVLELGCATGFHTQYLRDRINCQVVGVEIDSSAAKQARNFAKKVIVGSLDEPAVWGQAARSGPYDAILASNILEHLLDPWQALAHLHRLLKPEGVAIITIPNVAFWRSRLRLLRGTWEYEEFGIFDATHTKFFTLLSMRNALHQAGFRIKKEGYDPAGGAKWFTPLLKHFPNAYAYQIAFLVEKKA